MIFKGIHKIEYNYSDSITPSMQQLRMTPRSNSLQVVRNMIIEVEPHPIGSETLLDAENNEVLSIWFDTSTKKLLFECKWEVETLLENPFAFLLGPDILPPDFTHSELIRFQPYLKVNATPRLIELHTKIKNMSTNCLDYAMNASYWISTHIPVAIREVGSAVSAEETLHLHSGACRDLAVLHMDLCRLSGIPARFVSGYCYHGAKHVAHELHSWVEAWIPNGGWRGFDPTLGLAVANSHIAVCASADPLQTLPVIGTFGGKATASLKYHVQIEHIGTIDSLAKIA
jgi:transglutaminase-like putative cysteine protease